MKWKEGAKSAIKGDHALTACQNVGHTYQEREGDDFGEASSGGADRLFLHHSARVCCIVIFRLFLMIIAHPISNRLTVSRVPTGNSRELRLKASLFNFVSCFLPTPCMNTRRSLTKRYKACFLPILKCKSNRVSV